jgi:hypothetical protein
MIGTLPPTTPVQYTLPRLPPVPKADASALPVHMALKRACVTRFVESGWLSIGTSILPAIQRLRLDDTLYFNRGTWRIELVCLASGYPHYRLYWMPKRHYLFGLADIRLDNAEKSIEKVRYASDIGRSPHLKLVQRHLAAYVAAFGAVESDLVLVKGDARTPLNADTSRVKRLFKVRG